MNYLAMGPNQEPWTEDEDRLLVEKFIQFGPKWAQIALFFRNRSNINVRNRLNSIKALAERMERPLNDIVLIKWRSLPVAPLALPHATPSAPPVGRDSGPVGPLFFEFWQDEDDAFFPSDDE
jgi:hypothetical protein